MVGVEDDQSGLKGRGGGRRRAIGLESWEWDLVELWRWKSLLHCPPSPSHLSFTLAMSQTQWQCCTSLSCPLLMSAMSQIQQCHLPLVQCSHSSSPNTLCYICSDFSHHGLFCPMYTCPICQETMLGHAAHHCLETQCGFCRWWGHSNDVCNLWICGRCNAMGHVVDNCPVNPLTQPDACSTYGGTYSDDDDLNTLVDDN